MDAARDADFWEVFHHSRTPLLLMDERRRWTDANAAALECIGVTREELLGSRYGDRAPGDLQGRLAELAPQLRDGVPVTMPWAFVRPDGGRRDVFLHIHHHAIADRDLVILLSAPPQVPAGGLTPREREITTLLAEGCDGREIAERLVLSPETVRTHVRNAMERVDARTRAHLIAIALRERLIDP
jgi:PAS domain S-box-containing protein